MFLEKLADEGVHVPISMFIGEEILRAHDQAGRV
jgi:hypothetical protein